jgi:hypothetical protein
LEVSNFRIGFLQYLDVSGWDNKDCWGSGFVEFKVFEEKRFRKFKVEVCLVSRLLATKVLKFLGKFHGFKIARFEGFRILRFQGF